MQRRYGWLDSAALLSVQVLPGAISVLFLLQLAPLPQAQDI